MKILVFTEGTILMHRNALGQPKESLYDWKSYIPIGNVAERLNAWKKQGAEILYLTSRTKTAGIDAICDVLKRQGFPEGQILHRCNKEEFKDVAERAMPDVIVEDDCESIGGESQKTFTHLKPNLKKENQADCSQGIRRNRPAA